MSEHEGWWETLKPWLDSVRVSADGEEWSGLNPPEGVIDMEGEEGPIVVRSVSGGNAPRFRRTLVSCVEYTLDLLLILDVKVRVMEWAVEAPVLRAIQPPTFPRAKTALPLEARWIVEWHHPAGPTVRTSGESGRGTVGRWGRKNNPRRQRWSIARQEAQSLFVVCHEPAERPGVHGAFALVQDGRYTVRVTGDGFFDYWMLDPEHTPAPLNLGASRVEVGSGWGFVRLERGRETTYGALRQDWGRM